MQIIFGHGDDEMSSMSIFANFFNPLKFDAFQQLIDSEKSGLAPNFYLPVFWDDVGKDGRPDEISLDAQPFSTFSPPTFDNQSATPGAHPGQETIRPGPLQIMRLISSLHNNYPYTFISNYYSKLEFKTLFSLFVKITD